MAKNKSRYGVHPGVAMVQKWIVEMPAKTGRSLDEWMHFIKTEGPADEKVCRLWLKETHGIGTVTAWWLAERAKAGPMGLAEEDPAEYLRMADQYVADQYAGAKAALKPIYDALLDLGLSMGTDAKACPCKTMVPFYRNHVFAQIKPTTRTRIDLGLSIKDEPLQGRLIDTGGLAKKDRITRRIEIKSLKDINAEVKKYLKLAYKMDA